MQRFAPGHWIGPLAVFREGRRRHHAAMRDAKPAPPMRAGGVADVRHAAVRRIRRLQELRRRRHAPGEPRQLATAAGIADNRCRAVGIDIERRFKIAEAVGRRAGDVADRLLIRGQIIQVADVDGPSLVRIAADF